MKGYVRSVIVCFAVISGVLFVLVYYESILDMKLKIMKICNIYLKSLNQELYIIKLLVRDGGGGGLCTGRFFTQARKNLKTSSYTQIFPDKFPF